MDFALLFSRSDDQKFEFPLWDVANNAKFACTLTLNNYYCLWRSSRVTFAKIVNSVATS